MWKFTTASHVVEMASQKKCLRRHKDAKRICKKRNGREADL